jgi:hypothetical protein
VAPWCSAIPSLVRSTAPITVMPSSPATSREALSTAEAIAARSGGITRRIGCAHRH